MIKVKQPIHLETALSALPKDTLKGYVIDLVNETVLDYGRTIAPEIITHIVTRTYHLVTSSRYKMMSLNDVITAFNQGKIGTYGGESRVSVAGIERWLANYFSVRCREIAAQSIRKQNTLKTSTGPAMIGGCEFADAVLWKKNLPRSIRHEINEIQGSYEVIVDAIKQGVNPREALQEKFNQLKQIPWA